MYLEIRKARIHLCVCVCVKVVSLFMWESCCYVLSEIFCRQLSSFSNQSTNFTFHNKFSIPSLPETSIMIEWQWSIHHQGKFLKLQYLRQLSNIFVDLESRPVVQKIIRDTHETLGTIVKNNTDLFQENGNLTNCSSQLHPTKDKVLHIRYYLLHAVFQIQMINRQSQMFKRWISALDETSPQFGTETVRLQFQSVVDEYLQQIVG